MSRIFVNHLPPKRVTVERLRDVFSHKGEITDARLRSKDGTSRQFAYIGYRTQHEAQEAIKYFNNSFIDTYRISVEIARKVGDENAPRPWSRRYSLKKKGKINENAEMSSNGNLTRGSKNIKKEPEADDPEFLELLDVMQRGESRIWSNDMAVEPMVSDDAMEVEADGKTAQQSKADSDDLLHTGRLFVRNMPYTATEEELMGHFSKFGEISDVHLVLDKETKRSRGFAYILYPNPESAARAMEELDNLDFQGRLLRVSPAKHRETPDRVQVNDTRNLPETFKQEREEQRKASEAGGNTKAWNSLFMSSDTILEYIGRVYGVSKSELLDRESEDAAVLLALAETKVIAETKEALARAGVNVTSLEEFASGKGDEKNRSKHILLVKNLPFASTEKELAQMFGKFASLQKIILPPTKTMALVVFLEPAEARAAFKGMAYKKYKDAPLYLEWAPGNILEPKALAPDNNEKNSDVGENDVRRVDLVEIDTDTSESNVLYVTNLSFKTSDESLKKHLTQVVKQGKILSVKIIEHVKNGKKVSKGYGFVELDSIETATSVYRDLQGTVVDGHALKLRFCENKRRYTVGKGSDKDTKTCNKLIVKNVPFEASKGEVRGLFSNYGQIKSVRRPKRNMGKPAGFAFVEFVTKQEAWNAKKAFSSTHLYGRPLVIEWSNDDNSMKALRVRSAAKFLDQENQNHPKKRRRIAF